MEATNVQVRPAYVEPQSVTSVLGELASVTVDVMVTGVTADNRAVRPGDLFLALPGVRTHGAKFAPAAVAAGAVAVVTDDEGFALLSELSVPLIVVPDVAAHAGEIAARVYGEPAQHLETFAVTGTNGKTTTAYMIDDILRSIGQTTGLIGTVAIRLGNEEVPAKLTTPQAADLQSMLAALVERGGQSLVMEASSHAIAQNRIKPIVFNVAGFTNLTADHLDFHNTLDEYFVAKSTLFDAQHSRRGLIITDTEWGRKLFARLEQERPGAAVPLAITTAPLTNTEGRGWHVSHASADAKGSIFTLVSETGAALTVSVSLPGDFNIANAALALAMVAESRISAHNGDVAATIDELSAVLADGISPTVPGRMEIVGVHPRVVVDFAHNEDALIKAMEALRPTTEGKLIVLTGSAGDRDKTKRPAMARAVAAHADLLYLTDDDPHSEDPAAIRNDMKVGIPEGFTYVEIADRASAITEAILNAAPADTILVAGRGHETIQEVAGVENVIDDRQVSRDALQQRKA